VLDAHFNGVEIALIAVVLIGAALALYCWRRHLESLAAEERAAAERDRDPLDDLFRGRLAFDLVPQVYDQEGPRMSRGTPEGVRPLRDDLMGAKEAADLLGVPRSSLSRWLETGRLRPYGVIKASPVFRAADIQRFKDEREAIEKARQKRRKEAVEHEKASAKQKRRKTVAAA
jgi:hypothetical protein